MTINNIAINSALIKNTKKQSNIINKNEEVKEFNKILQQTESNTVMFSKHASERLNSRNLSLSNSQIKRLEKGVEKAKQKGVTDSLVLIDNIALLVNIKNKTVVTAVDSASDKVYTNINGTVII